MGEHNLCRERLTRLLADHRALRADYLNTLRDHPDSWTVKRPFDPKQRPRIGQELAPDECLIVEWVKRLDAVLDELVTTFNGCGLGYRLREFPLAASVTTDLYLVDKDNKWLVKILDKHIEELELELAPVADEDKATEAKRNSEQENSVAETDLGPRLREKRKKEGLTLAALAERLGCDPSTLSRIETTGQIPHAALGKSIDEFLKCG